MAADISERELEHLLDRFCETFATFDGTAIARFFKAPGIALREDGELRGFRDQDDIAAYYQTALDRYRSADCSACHWSDLHVQHIRESSVVATVTWDLVGGARPIRRWRQAYFIARFDGEPLIYGSAFAELR